MEWKINEFPKLRADDFAAVEMTFHQNTLRKWSRTSASTAGAKMMYTFRWSGSGVAIHTRLELATSMRSMKTAQDMRPNPVGFVGFPVDE